MNAKFGKSNIEILYYLTKAGLHPYQIFCQCCDRKMLFYYRFDEYEQHWRCPQCFHKTSYLRYCLLIGHSLDKFDSILEMFCLNFFSGKNIFLNRIFHSDSSKIDRLFRSSVALYWKTKIKPYLQLPGLVEMDETLVTRKFAVNLNYPQHKWVFGMLCRKTRLLMLWHVKNRQKETLHPII